MNAYAPHPSRGSTGSAAFLPRRQGQRLALVRRPAASRGFTLIELLTVIAIIGILAAILIPVVGKVRSSAKRAACLSQVRQMGAALLMCANENRAGFGPYDGRDAGNTDISKWRYNSQLVQFGLLLPYMSVANANPPRTPEIFVCPGAPQPWGDQVRNSTEVTSYWFNPAYGSNTNSKKNIFTLPPRRATIIDACHWWNTTTQAHRTSHDYLGMNVARADGSALWIPISKTNGLPEWDWALLDRL